MPPRAVVQLARGAADDGRPACRDHRKEYLPGQYKTKSKTIKEICRILLSLYDGRVPDDLDELMKLPGVGRKTANLVVTLGFGKPGICVDTHVHRITNRWDRSNENAGTDGNGSAAETSPAVLADHQ